MLRATTESYSSARDQHPVSGDVTFYGVLTDIIELYYSKDVKFLLFKCDWVDNRRGLVEKDNFDFTLVNFNHLLYRGNEVSDEPFILATQAQQVFYVKDPVDENWEIVVKMKQREFFDNCAWDTTTSKDVTQNQVEPYISQQLENTVVATWVRSDVVGATVDPAANTTPMDVDESYESV